MKDRTKREREFYRREDSRRKAKAAGNPLDNFHRDAVWKSNDLIFGRRVVASVVPDSNWPQMWRVSLPSGHVTEMVNLSRARDAARSLALKALSAGLFEEEQAVVKRIVSAATT